MTVDIQGNLSTYLKRRRRDTRYASFDYCYNYFQHARHLGHGPGLGSAPRLERSCLHLGFFLASWGMMRGNCELLQRSLHALAPVIEAIAQEEDATWELDVCESPDGVDSILALYERIRDAYKVTATDVLVTKTMLGVFGCVPAFDRFFNNGFGVSKLSRGALLEIGDYYAENRRLINRRPVYTLDFTTGHKTTRRYPHAKLIDMIFFQEGRNRLRDAGNPGRPIS